MFKGTLHFKDKSNTEFNWTWKPFEFIISYLCDTDRRGPAPLPLLPSAYPVHQRVQGCCDIGGPSLLPTRYIEEPMPVTRPSSMHKLLHLPFHLFTTTGRCVQPMQSMAFLQRLSCVILQVDIIVMILWKIPFPSHVIWRSLPNDCENDASSCNHSEG